jgi:hypothetical protein
MIGPAVPIPAPQSVIDSITSVQVTSGRPQRVVITFAVSKKSTLLTTMLPAARSDGHTRDRDRTLGSLPNVLMDGLVTARDAAVERPGQSTLTITGED